MSGFFPIREFLEAVLVTPLDLMPDGLKRYDSIGFDIRGRDDRVDRRDDDELCELELLVVPIESLILCLAGLCSSGVPITILGS